MEISIGVSNKHVHLNQKDYETLFGDIPMEVVRPINQPGQFASNLKLTLKTEKGLIENVRILGPVRDYTQVEISKTDAYKLGINPPIRASGDLEGSSPITLIGPHGEVNLSQGCIIADRHIHATEEDAKKYGLEGLQKVKVLFESEKGGVLYNVNIRVASNSYFEMHIDTDDANANLISNGDKGTIYK